MKFPLANWGIRGEVEPYVAVGRELVRRGHDVHMAVAPKMVSFTEAAAPTAVAYGRDLKRSRHRRLHSRRLVGRHRAGGRRPEGCHVRGRRERGHCQWLSCSGQQVS